MAKTCFSAKARFIQYLSGLTARGVRHVLAVASIRAREGGGTYKATAEYTFARLSCCYLHISLTLDFI